MTQKEILEYYEDNGGLRCGDWSIKEIKVYIKNDMGSNQRVFDSTCRELKRTAQIYQR
jgi:hypothetical protein